MLEGIGMREVEEVLKGKHPFETQPQNQHSFDYLSKCSAEWAS
jgi:hypothetical protein